MEKIKAERTGSILEPAEFDYGDLPNPSLGRSRPRRPRLISIIAVSVLCAGLALTLGSTPTDAVKATDESAATGRGQDNKDGGNGHGRPASDDEPGSRGKGRDKKDTLIVELGEDDSEADEDDGEGDNPTETTVDGAAVSASSSSSTSSSSTVTVDPWPSSTNSTTTTQRSTTTQPTTQPTTTQSSTTQPTTTTAAPGGGRLIWEENFDRLDTSRWRIEHSNYGGINGELQCYTPDNVWVADGSLVLRARKESYECPSAGSTRYTSGMVRLMGIEFKPGQALEFRVKLNPADRHNQAGLFPAVWSSSWAAGGWPKGGEVDYLEVMTVEDPSRAMFSMHFQNSSGRHELKNKGAYLDEYFSDSWHTVRFEYGYNGHLRWLMDGRETFVVDHAGTVQGWPAPFDQAINQIKINLALGGKPGPLDDSALGSSGATFQVDYLRIYQM